MVDEALAQTSNTLFLTAFGAYVLAFVAAFARLALTSVSREHGIAETRRAAQAGFVVAALTGAGLLAHVASIATRGFASGRPPWMNMYEYSSAMALVAVGAGVAIVWRRREYRNLLGFVLAAAVLMMGSALLLYVEAAPVQPALDSWWRLVHVTMISFSSSVLMVGFAIAALYLVKETAERRVAERSGRFGAGSVGAAQLPPELVDETRAVEGLVGDTAVAASPEASLASPLEQRRALSPTPFVAAPAVAAFALALVLGTPLLQALGYALALGVLGLATWWAVPFLPAAAQLDRLAFGINAFAYPLFTLAVIMGAMWAEVAWGRYWGWDPKETSSFVTWVLYAGYFHARATAGWRGRRAAWLNVIAYASLLVTYYVVNLFVVGLHSYAGVN